MSFSELESFYMVAVEAMSVGCPVVVPQISSIEESVGDAGLTFASGDVDGALEYIEKLLDPGYRSEWSSRSCEWAAQFDASVCADRIVQSVAEKMG